MAQAITQKQAKEYRARVKRLESFLKTKRYGWDSQNWPEGLFVGRIDVDPKTIGIVETARKLRHHVEVTTDNNSLTLWADPIPDPKDI
jgi:hypothetical protein